MSSYSELSFSELTIDIVNKFSILVLRPNSFTIKLGIIFL